MNAIGFANTLKYFISSDRSIEVSEKPSKVSICVRVVNNYAYTMCHVHVVIDYTISVVDY